MDYTTREKRPTNNPTTCALNWNMSKVPSVFHPYFLFFRMNISDRTMSFECEWITVDWKIKSLQDWSDKWLFKTQDIFYIIIELW